MMFSAAAAAVAVASLAQGASAQTAMCRGMCTYQVTADQDWTPERFPTDFPTDPENQARFSPLWTVSHDLSFTFWREGELSNPGIQSIAETGAGDDFLAEAAECEAAGSCGVAAGFMCGEEPREGVCTSQGDFTVTPGYPYVSVATMIAPSPDWFTGVDTFNLCGDDGEWIEVYDRDLFQYDAGTDSGVTFASENEVTSPAEPISAFSDISPETENIFFNPDLGDTLPIGTIRFVLMSCTGGDDMPAATDDTAPPAESTGGSTGSEGNEGDEGDEGNEGNEGDEGNEGNEGNEGDEGDEGNEGNEGDEGNEGNEGDEGDEGNEGNEGN